MGLGRVDLWPHPACTQGMQAVLEGQNAPCAQVFSKKGEEGGGGFGEQAGKHAANLVDDALLSNAAGLIDDREEDEVRNVLQRSGGRLTLLHPRGRHGRAGGAAPAQPSPSAWSSCSCEDVRGEGA